MNIGLIILIISVLLFWSVGGMIACYDRYNDWDELDDIPKSAFYHFIEGPISWIFGLLIIFTAIIRTIEWRIR